MIRLLRNTRSEADDKRLITKLSGTKLKWLTKLTLCTIWTRMFVHSQIQTRLRTLLLLPYLIRTLRKFYKQRKKMFMKHYNKKVVIAQPRWVAW